MKRFTAKHIGVISAVLVIVALLSMSCSSAPQPAVAEPAARQGVEAEAFVAATEAPEARAAGSSEPVLNPNVSGEVEFWHFWASPVRRNAVRRMVATCEQMLPNIDVIDAVYPFGDIWMANVGAVAAGTGMPDVIVSDRPTLPRDAAGSVYMNLDPWASRDNVSRDQFYDWAWDQTVYDDGVYGIPFETDVSVLFWNKQLFAEAGLDPDTPPATWDELEEFADKLDRFNENGTPARIAFFPLWNRGTELWQYTNDARIVSADGTVRINNPHMVETVEWMKSWVDRYGGWQNLLDFRAKYGAPPNDPFMSGDLAMLVDIYGYNSQLAFYRPRVELADGTEQNMEWGVSPLPYNASPGNWSGGFSLSIPTGADNAEAAWEFIKCATGPWGQSSWARDTQAQPTNLKAASDPVLAADPTWRVVEEALKVSTGGHFLTIYPNWNEQLVQRWERVWRGELTPQEMLDEAQAAVDDAIK